MTASESIGGHAGGDGRGGGGARARLPRRRIVDDRADRFGAGDLVVDGRAALDTRETRLHLAHERIIGCGGRVGGGGCGEGDAGLGRVRVARFGTRIRGESGRSRARRAGDRAFAAESPRRGDLLADVTASAAARIWRVRGTARGAFRRRVARSGRVDRGNAETGRTALGRVGGERDGDAGRGVAPARGSSGSRRRLSRRTRRRIPRCSPYPARVRGRGR